MALSVGGPVCERPLTVNGTVCERHFLLEALSVNGPVYGVPVCEGPVYGGPV